MNPASPLAERTATKRDLALDAFKGAAILAVILHHLSGFGLRQIAPGSVAYFAATVINRFFLFCVPAFLFLTIFLLTRSLIRRPVSAPEFWRTRYPRIVRPYLVWSVFYAVFNAALHLYRRRDLIDPLRWLNWLLYGKANFHLYFLVIVLQIYFFLPDLVRAYQNPDERDAALYARRILASALVAVLGLSGSPFAPIMIRPPMRWIGWTGLMIAIYLSARTAGVLALRLMRKREAIALEEKREDSFLSNYRLWIALAFALQIAVYWTHKFAIRSPNPATLAFWHVSLALIGIETARHYEAFQAAWPRLRAPLGLLVATAFAAFLPGATSFMNSRLSTNAFYYSTTYWLYTGLASILLLGMMPGFVTRWARAGRGLALLGAYSMELYLIHPAPLALAGRVSFHGGTLLMAAYLVALLVAVTGATLGIAVGLRKAGWSGFLFGR